MSNQDYTVNIITTHVPFIAISRYSVDLYKSLKPKATLYSLVTSKRYYNAGTIEDAEVVFGKFPYFLDRINLNKILPRLAFSKFKKKY
jgi:hypothetical protein